MESVDNIVAKLKAECPEARVSVLPNGAPGGTSSLLVEAGSMPAVALWLRDDPTLRLDYCSNVTGVDWPPRQEKAKVKRQVDGVEKEVEESRSVPGYLEVVYHLYSMALKQGPLVIRMRTVDRADATTLPSMTPIWRSCELQEREVFDLYGVVFEGHPDLRRLLMWEGYRGHPMRRDFEEPDDYEYEPTPHDRVLERAKARFSKEEAG